MKLSVDIFKETIKQCWSRETSSDPEHWADNNPSYRQCLITALLANEFLGLDVHAEKVTLDSNYQGYHYFNTNQQAMPIRFCEEQFAHEKIIAKKSARNVSSGGITVLLEHNPELKQRYEILKNNFKEQLQKIIQ